MLMRENYKMISHNISLNPFAAQKSIVEIIVRYDEKYNIKFL